MEALTVACCNVGNYVGQGQRYVDTLASMCKRHLPAHEFVCLTESPYSGYWCKLSLFEPGRFTGNILYLDLDVVIAGDLSGLVSLLDTHDFWALDDFAWPLSHAKELDQFMSVHPHGPELRALIGGPGTCNSSVMLWRDEAGRDIWEEYSLARISGLHGDQNWITQIMRDRLHLIPPGWARSYRYGGDGPITVFHGSPKPHEVAEVSRH